MDRKIVLIILLTLILLITPVSAKEITSKVDDKKIIHSYGDGYYFIHTVDFGDIEVREREYQKIFIGDNITFDTESSWGIYNILKINGGKINGEI
jgi:hypothetical protein